MGKKKWLSSEGVGDLGPPRQPPEEIVTLEGAAKWLKMTPGQVYELTRRRCRRPLPTLKAGKWLRFKISEIDSWLAQK